jgi:hypothetical protein
MEVEGAVFGRRDDEAAPLGRSEDWPYLGFLERFVSYGVDSIVRCGTINKDESEWNKGEMEN